MLLKEMQLVANVAFNLFSMGEIILILVQTNYVKEFRDIFQILI